MEPTRRSLHVATGINNVALRLQCKSQLQLPNITVIGKLWYITALEAYKLTAKSLDLFPAYTLDLSVCQAALSVKNRSRAPHTCIR